MRLKAFTLIELLIVIAVIAFLAAVTVPILSQSKAQAKAVFCSSNLKQISAAFYIYDSENKTLPSGFIPSADTPPTGFLGNRCLDSGGWYWPDFLKLSPKQPYKVEGTVLQCPAKNLNDVLLKNDILCGNYGVNMSLCKLTMGTLIQKEFTGLPLPLRAVRKPASTFLVADSGYSIVNWHHAADIAPVTFKIKKIADNAYIPGLKIYANRSFLYADMKNDAVRGRHPNKTVNTIYIDGHLEREKAEIYLVEKNGDDYINRSPLWIP